MVWGCALYAGALFSCVCAVFACPVSSESRNDNFLKSISLFEPGEQNLCVGLWFVTVARER